MFAIPVRPDCADYILGGFRTDLAGMSHCRGVRTMLNSRVALRVGLLVATAVALAIAASQVREKRNLAIATVDDIEG